MRLSGRNTIFIGRLNPVARMSFWKNVVFATLTTTPLDVAALPAGSCARAVIVCWPFATVRVSQLTPYGASVSSTPTAAPSTKNCTPATARSSVASAVATIAPVRVALAAGAVIEVTGGT